MLNKKNKHGFFPYQIVEIRLRLTTLAWQSRHLKQVIANESRRYHRQRAKGNLRDCIGIWWNQNLLRKVRFELRAVALLCRYARAKKGPGSKASYITVSEAVRIAKQMFRIDYPNLHEEIVKWTCEAGGSVIGGERLQ